MATATTMNISTVLTDAEESITPVVKEVERTFCFTDVPCGAMKVTKEEPKPNPEVKDDVSQGFLSFCGGLERAFCFSDLQDIDGTDIERIKSMKSNVENEAPQKDDSSPPAVEPADTESMSDESVKDEEEAAKKVAPVAEKPLESTPVAKPEQTEKKAEEAEKSESKSLPPANAHQAASKSSRDGKPMNALQASKEAKKKEGKKKGWKLFRRSSRKGIA